MSARRRIPDATVARVPAAQSSRRDTSDFVSIFYSRQRRRPGAQGERESKNEKRIYRERE